MIRRLKIKFIVIASLAMLLALIVVLGVVNGVNYYNSKVEIFSVISRISENHGHMPERLEYRSMIGETILKDESRFTLRFFSAVRNEKTGEVIEMDRGHAAVFSEADAFRYLAKAEERRADEGFFYEDNTILAFQKTESDDGERALYVILDCSRQLWATKNFLKFSLYIGLISMIVLLFFLFVFSKRAVAPIAENMEKQKMFITNAGHELKTPLAIISANTEVLEMMEGKNEWTESTMEQVKRMNELIAHLITLSKLQEKDDIVLTEVSFTEIADKVSAEFRVLAEKNQLTYETEIARDRVVKADEAGLRELVSILLDNAVKYCTEGGAVRVSLEAKGHSSVLSVSNTYPENPDVDYNRFFDRFYREDKSHNSEKKGFGIGLSMARHFTEIFNGKISVHHKNGMITFSVIL